MFNRDMFEVIQPPFDRKQLIATGIFADTAMKVEQRNDFSVLLYAGTDGKNVYIIDILRGKWTAPELLEQAKMFWDRHKPHRLHNPAPFTGFHIEDKASGTGLIQTLRSHTAIPVIAVQRSRDKVSRANDVLSFFNAGRCKLVGGYDSQEWREPLLQEMCAFSPAMTHMHDDQVDCMVDAVAEFLLPSGGMLARMDWS